MTTTINDTENLVKRIRKIRDEISSEIKDMTFEEERAYLDKLLSNQNQFSPGNTIVTAGTESIKHQE